MFTSFFISLALSQLIYLYYKGKGLNLIDSEIYEPQRIHENFVPRIGGVAIYVGSLASFMVLNKSNNCANLILLCSLPVFLIGTIEDVTKKVGVRKRLFFALLSSLLVFSFIDMSINKVDIPYLDYLLEFKTISFIFTIIAVVGLINSYNIVDGLNGLASMLSIIALSSIAILSYIINDLLIFQIATIICASILGFFLINYPNGKIFLGDGGAYFCGFIIATLSCFIVNRNQQISPWFVILINAYPIIETIFSIYRRSLHQKTSPSSADRLHMHSLIFRRVFVSNTKNGYISIQHANPKSVLIIWLYASLNAILAITFFDKKVYLFAIFLTSYTIYLFVYRKIIYFSLKK